MWQDKHGQFVLTEQDLCDLYLRDPDRKLGKCLVQDQIKLYHGLELSHEPEIAQYLDAGLSQEQFDRRSQQCWHMPDEYKNLDIAAWLLNQCQNDAERQRTGQELLLYMDRDMFPLLQYLKYLVDTLRVNNVVWGVGRGSSVSSFVLYLIGVHKINSIHYDLDISEFLR